MFSRKGTDNKKHPFKNKGSRSPKPYKKTSLAKLLRDTYTTEEVHSKKGE